MAKVRVAAFSISVDGFGAGPRQDINNPLGIGGFELHAWAHNTKVFKTMHGQGGGDTGVDNELAQRSFQNVGAWVLGRNMFGPVRGPWKDDSWKGWWGDDPPYHVPVFVLTHHPRPALEMAGGTTFHFVAEGPDVALKLAKESAGDKDVRIGGGVSTVRQYLLRGNIDEMHLAISPVLLGEGKRLFEGIHLPKLGFAPSETVYGENAMHVILKKRTP